MLKCAECYIACFERLCDYLNGQAFAYMAVSGDNFTTSAWNGFLLHIKHMMKFSFANLIASIFIFIGKLGLTIGNVFSMICIMEFVTKSYFEVKSVFGPCLVVGGFSYITASIFLGLFDEVVTAMMTSLAIDMDMNDG